MFMKHHKQMKRSMVTSTGSLSTFKKMTVAAIISTSLAGCGADIEQADSNQINSWSRAAVAEAAGDNCEFGGQKVETGSDTNGDGILQDDEINKVDYLCALKTTDTYINEMASLDDNFWRTYSLFTEDNTAAPDDANYRFQGDLLRIKRGTNTAEYLDYVVGGSIESAVISAYYWEGDTPEVAPFKIYVSQVGANNLADWTEVSVNQEVVGDYTQRDTDEDQSDGQNDNWIQVDFTISDIVNSVGEGYDFIRVEFPVVASEQAWHPQLGNLSVDFVTDASTASNNNAKPAPATDPDVEPTIQNDDLSSFNNAFSRSANLVLDSGESQRFRGDNNRYKRSSNTAEFVQYEVYGAVQSITLNTHYTSKFDVQPFLIEVSKTGGDDAAEWTTLSSTVAAVDGDEEVDGWLAFTQTAMVDSAEVEFDFVRVTFPVMAKEGVDADYETWVPELGNVAIAYAENYALSTDNVIRDLSGIEISGGQAPLAVPTSVTDTMAANNATSLFSHYVTRGEGSNGIGDSNKLYSDDSGKEFRFVSYNTPNLVLTEDPIWDITPVFEQEDGIKTIADMGGKITRIYTMGIQEASNPTKVKHIHWDENGNFVYNEDVFVAMDNLLAIANKHGVRIQVPFIDRSAWWGGISHFADKYGKTSVEFFTDRATIDGFKEVITYVLNRVNTVTGVAYKDDPAIFAWETGNELRTDDVAVIEAWTAEIAAHIKSIDSNHLVMDGREARATKADSESEHEMRMSNAALFDTNIDIVSNHYYGDNFSARIELDMTTVGSTKPFVVGEIGYGDIEMEAAINTVVNDGATGILLWSLRTHDVNGGFKDHDDGSAHSYHWPGFADNFVYNEAKIMANTWEMAYTIDGEAKPDIPAPAKAPVMLASPSNLDIRWQGVTSAQYYDIERSDNGTDGWVLVGDDIEIGNTRATNYILADRTDSFGNVHTNVKHQILFQDASTVEGETYYYRAKAINASGESAWSNVIGTNAALVENGIVQDNLSTLTSASALSDSNNLFVDSGNTEFFENDDAGRIKHGGYTEEWLMYSFSGDVNSFMVKTYFWRGNLQTDVADFKVQLSTDGISWDDFASESFDIAQRGDWQQIDLVGRSIDSGYKHLRVVFPVTGDDYSSWAQQLGDIKIGVGSQVITDLHDKQIDGGFIVDDFNAYPDDASIKATWVDQAWTTISLDNSTDSQQMQVQYDVGSDGYAGVLRTFGGAQDWTSGNALRFHLTHQNAGNILVIQLDEATIQDNPNGKVDSWEWALILDETNMDTEITIKFSDFLYNHNFGASDFHANSVLNQDNILKMGIWQNESFNPYGDDTPALTPTNNNTGENLLIDDISVVTVD